MQTTDQVIDEILLRSPYGGKAYQERQKRLRENEPKEGVEDVVIDHPQQTFIYFEENNYDN